MELSLLGKESATVNKTEFNCNALVGTYNSLINLPIKWGVVGTKLLNILVNTVA